MFCVTVIFQVLPDRRDRFLARVAQQAKDSLDGEPGCHRFDVWSDASRPAEVYLYEVYEDRAAFDSHMQTRHFKAFDRDIADWVADKSVTLWADRH